MTELRDPERAKRLFDDAIVILQDAAFPADSLRTIEYEEGKVSMSLEIFASLVLAAGLAIDMARNAIPVDMLGMTIVTLQPKEEKE